MLLSLAVDLGTTSIAAIAVSGDGRIVTSVEAPNTASLAGRPRNHAEQDPTKIRDIAAGVLRELGRDLPGTPACLGLTGQMHGVLLTDESRQPLTPLITWQDRRANQPCQPSASDDGAHAAPAASWLTDYLAGCRDSDLARTGCRLAPGYLAVTLSLLKRTAAIPDRACRASFLADWLAAELTDTSVVTDRSNAAASGVFDLVGDQWSRPLLEAGGLSEGWLPEVVESGTVIGSLVPEWASQTGLPAGLPICGAIGDNQAAVLGSLPSDETAIQINVGTGGQISWPIPNFCRIPGMDTRYLPRDRFLVVGAGLAGGDAYAWVNRTLGDWLGRFGEPPSPERIYDHLADLAANIPADADGLTCTPVFRGTRRRPSDRGTFHGVTFDNFTPGHVARAVLSGIAEGFAWFLENAGEAAPTGCERIVGSGNGLRRNPLLVDCLARRFERPVYLTESAQEAALGAALLSGAGNGVWPDLTTAGRSIQLVRHDRVGSLDGLD